jgi:ABC-type polysaccharide/polyol phosphate transport system ATPase subunit
VNLFVKGAKILSKSKHVGVVGENGAKLIKVLEGVCEKDKAMANLKGKIKEIKHIIN